MTVTLSLSGGAGVSGSLDGFKRKKPKDEMATIAINPNLIRNRTIGFSGLIPFS